MKKLFYILCLLFSASLSHAAFNNNYGIWNEWRSTETCSSVSNLIIATGTVFVAEVIVTSGSAGSFLTLSNSSTTLPIVTRTTSTARDVSSAGITYPVRTTFKQGLNFTKTGAACVRIHWEWYMEVPTGKENEGKHIP